MKTTTQINIERRESGDSEWQTYSSGWSEDSYEACLQGNAEGYPHHHFRAVEYTTSAKVLKTIPARIKHPAPNPTR